MSKDNLKMVYSPGSHQKNLALARDSTRFPQASVRAFLTITHKKNSRPEPAAEIEEVFLH